MKKTGVVVRVLEIKPWSNEHGMEIYKDGGEGVLFDGDIQDVRVDGDGMTITLRIRVDRVETR